MADLLGASSDYQVVDYSRGKDVLRGGEKTTRKTFVKQTDFPGQGALDIDPAINAARAQARKNIKAGKPWHAVTYMLMEAELRANRNNAGDRAEARKIMNKVIILCEYDDVKQAMLMKQFGITMADISDEDWKAFDKKLHPLENPACSAAQAYIGIADLVLKQLNNKEKTTVSTDAAIQYCIDAIKLLEGQPANRRDYFNIGKAYILQAQLRALRNGSEDTDAKITEILSHVNYDVASLEAGLKENPYVYGDKRPVDMDADYSLKKTKQGITYNNQKARLEVIKLLLQSVEVPRQGTPAYDKLVKALNDAISACVEIKGILSQIGKLSDYLGSDVALTEANLTAKLARLTEDDAMREKAITLFNVVAAQTFFSDVKAIALVGSWNLSIELSKFNWDDANTILNQYFNPSAGRNNLRYAVDEGSYSLAEIELFESLLRNSNPNSPVTGFIGGSELIAGENPNYKASLVASGDIIKNIGSVNVRNPLAKTMMKARAKLQNARAKAFETVEMNNASTKITVLTEALKILDAIYTDILKEDRLQIAAILKSRGTTIMEESFYVAVANERASILEQIAWLENQDKEVKDVAKFDAAIAEYKNVIELCKYSRAPYDRGVSGRESARVRLVRLNLANIDIAKQKIDAIAGSQSDASTVLSAIDTLLIKVSAFEIPAEITSVGARAKLQANADRIKMEALCKKYFYINRQKAENLVAYMEANFSGYDKNKSARDNQLAFIGALYQDIKTIADTILPTDATACILEDPTYPIINMMGVNSVYMAIDRDAAAKTIVSYYNNYIVRTHRVGIKFDMIDALANAAVITINKDLKKAIVECAALKGKIDDLTAAAVDRAKAFVIRARLSVWFYDEKDVASDPSELLKVTGDKRTGAIADYEAALKLYASITSPTELAKLLENGATELELREEKALAEFVFANATLKEQSDLVSRIASYKLISSDIRTKILGKSTGTTGLSAEILKRVGMHDAAAMIKAKLTLISIMMAVSEPLAKGQITLAEAQAICGADITNESDIFKKCELMFGNVINEIDALSLSETQLDSLGIKKASVYARMAENYMILKLKFMAPVILIDSAIALRDELIQLKKDDEELLKDVSGKEKEVVQKRIATYTASLKTLEPAITAAQKLRDAYLAKANFYGIKMEAYLNSAQENAVSSKNTMAQAQVLLIKAQFAGWTAKGSNVDVVAALKIAAGLYVKAKQTYARIMDRNSSFDYAEVLRLIAVIPPKNNPSRDDTGDTSQIPVAEGVLKGIITEPGLLGARANIAMANLKISVAGRDTGKLKEAQKYLFAALEKLTGQKKATLQEYIDVIVGMKQLGKVVVDKTIIQALCNLAVVEARLYTLQGGSARIKAYVQIKKLLANAYDVVKPYEGEIVLKQEMSEFLYYRDQIVLSYHDALGGGDQVTFEGTPEYLKAYTAAGKSSDAQVIDLVKKMLEIRELK